MSLSLDRDEILSAVDPTGRGHWLGPIAQIEPYALDPRDLDGFGRDYAGNDSGLLFHRDLTKARSLLNAAGYPDGLQATLHATDAYGGVFNPLHQACAASAAAAGFDFRISFKGYGEYLRTTFRGNFPDNWDGASSHLAIGPLFGGALDPDDILSNVYDRSSSRHSWGSPGRRPDSLSAVLGRDTGGHAGGWSHINAASGGGPDSDEGMHQMFAAQRGILDFHERLAYIQDIQRYLATKMYVVPYVSVPGIIAFNPWVKQVDPRNGHVISNQNQRIWPKNSYAQATETDPFLFLDLGQRSDHVAGSLRRKGQPALEMSSTRPGGYSAWLSIQVVTASWILPRLHGVRAIWKRTRNRWVGYGVESSGRKAMGSQDFEIRYGDVLYLTG